MFWFPILLVGSKDIEEVLFQLKAMASGVSVYMVVNETPEYVATLSKVLH